MRDKKDKESFFSRFEVRKSILDIFKNVHFQKGPSASDKNQEKKPLVTEMLSFLAKHEKCCYHHFLYII